METEIELKFFVSPDFSDVLRNKIPEIQVLQHHCRQLGNTYFDSVDHWLRQHDIGLRIRRFDGAYVQTVKTAGHVIAGLHQRPEYNAEHTCNHPDLTLHCNDIWPKGRDVETLQSQLIALFSTNFTREQWLVAMSDGSQIEVAFDQGVVEAGDKQSPICEVELELKSGQIDALFLLARHLSEQGGMRLGNQSKAAKGYRLAMNLQGDSVKEITPLIIRTDDSLESSFIRSLEHILAHWHRHEQIYMECASMAALHEIRHAINLTAQLLTEYGSVVPQEVSAILRLELTWLDSELARFKQYDHTQTRHQRDELLELLQCARYTELLLELSRWIFTRGWQSFLDVNVRDPKCRNLC